MEINKVYLSLGSNLGDKVKTLNDAIEQINRLLGKVEKTSSFYETPPHGFASENSFVNNCILVKTSKTPLQVLKITQDIENSLGRLKKSKNAVYNDRIIDIDIILFNTTSIDTPYLTIPHKQYTKRKFVLIPLGEIAPNLELQDGLTIDQLIDQCQDESEFKKLIQ